MCSHFRGRLPPLAILQPWQSTFLRALISFLDNELNNEYHDIADFSRALVEEDPHDYMLSRELKQV